MAPALTLIDSVEREQRASFDVRVTASGIGKVCFWGGP
jgi:hypothetical protein